MSLHWILVVTATLLHCCTATSILYDNIKINIERLKTMDCNEPDSTFYSPSGNNGCTITALQCSVLELEKLRAECFEPKTNMSQRVNRTRDSIILMLEKAAIGKADFNACFCGNEKPVEKTYKEFLDNLLKLIQMWNSSPQ